MLSQSLKNAVMFVPLVFVMGLGACAHDPEPFAREESFEEQQNQDGQQALRQRQEEMERQEQLASRRDGRGEDDSRNNEVSAEEQERLKAQEDARQRLREANRSLDQIELPASSSPLPSIRPVLGR